MRTLSRNKTTMYYAAYVEIHEETNEDDMQVGVRLEYTKPKMLTANVSPQRNAVTVQPYGTDAGYDRVIVLDRPENGLDENAVCWVDTMPVIKKDGYTDTPYDYIVKSVSESINGVRIGLKKVLAHG